MRNSVLEVAYTKIVGKHRPGPYVDIVVRTMNGESEPVKALLDSGASITWIPKSILKELHPEHRPLPLMISTPLKKVKKMYPRKVHILILKDGKPWEAVRPIFGVLAGESDIAYLGRDVMDSFRITLDGETCRMELK